MQDMANLTDLSQALRILASHSPDDVSAGLNEAAAQLDLAVQIANRYGDMNLQDMLQAALGNAELGIGMQLRRLLQEVSGIRDVGKDTHGLVMGVQHEVHTLQAVLEETARGLGKRLGDLEQGQGRMEAGQSLLATQVSNLGAHLSEVDLTIADFRETRDQSIAERRQHRKEIDQLRRAYTELSAQIARALALSARVRTKAADEADDAGVG